MKSLGFLMGAAGRVSGWFGSHLLCGARQIGLLTLLAVVGPLPRVQAHGGPPQIHQLVGSADGRTLVANATFGLVLSRDAGERWDWVCSPALPGARFGFPEPIALGAGGSILVPTTRGLLRGSVDGCDWDVVPELDRSFVPEVVAVPGFADALVTVTSNAGVTNQVYRSSDGGARWEATAGTLPVGFFPLRIRVAADNNQRLYVSGTAPATTTEPPRAFVYRSEDGGGTWAAQEFSRQPNDIDLLLLAVGATDQNEVWAHVRGLQEDRLVRSIDGAVSFADVETLDATSTGFARGFAFAATGPGEAWFGNAQAGLLRVSSGAVTPVDSAYPLTCLAGLGGALWACPSDVSGGHLLAKDDGGGTTFTPILANEAIPVIAQCDATSTVPSACASWEAELRNELNLQGAPDAGMPDAGVSGAGPSNSSCSAANTPSALPTLFLALLLWGTRTRPISR